MPPSEGYVECYRLVMVNTPLDGILIQLALLRLDSATREIVT